MSFQPPSLLIGKVWVPTCDALLCGFHTLQNAVENGQEARIVQIDFSAAFDRVNHLGILYKLCSVGIRGSVLSIWTQFLSNQSQKVMVDGCQSKLVNVVSGVPQGVFWARYCSSCTLQSFFPFCKNKPIGYAGDSTLMAVVPSPRIRDEIAESLFCDLGRVSDWCDLWGLKLNVS